MTHYRRAPTHAERRLEAVIAANTKHLRIAQNMTQADVAYAADLSVAEISRIECAVICERHVSVSAIARIADVLGVSPARLLMTQGEANAPKHISA